MEEQRPKRKAAKDAADAMKKSANSNGDSDDPDYEDKDSGSDGADTEWVQKHGQDEDEDEDDSEDDDEEDEEEEDSDSDIDDHSNSDKNKREVYNALARELGMNADELRKGVTMVLHAGSNPSFLKSFYTAKDIEGEHGLIRSAVMHIFGLDGPNGLFGGVSESASEWAMKAVDKLAAVMGGRTLKVFREIHGWNAALHTYIALRLASAIAQHGQLNVALQTGLQLEGTLQILAAKKFLETAMRSIRLEVGSGSEQVARTILSSLAEEYTMHKTIRRSTQPRSRKVDMRPPKGFALYFGSASHIVTEPLLHIVLMDEQGIAASVLSNERYGSGPISMRTAPMEALLLLGAGPLTSKALKKVAPGARMYLSMTAKYAGDQTSKCIRFGTTKYGQRRPTVDCVRFNTGDLHKVLGSPKYSQHLFSPHYDVNRKGKPLAVLKITLSTGAFRTAKHMKDLLSMVAAGTGGTKATDAKKKRKSGQ
jgi:hypothetical protein